MRTELTTRQSELLMAAVIIARSTSFVFSKLTIASMSPFNILAVRFLTAFGILLLLFHRQLGRCGRRILRNGFLLGTVYTVVMGFEMLGLKTAETSLASLIENSAFMLLPLLEIAVWRRYPTRHVVLGMLFAFAGLLVLDLGPGAVFTIGCVYCLAAMCFYALAIFLTAIFAREGGAASGRDRAARHDGLFVSALLARHGVRLPSAERCGMGYDPVPRCGVQRVRLYAPARRPAQS